MIARNIRYYADFFSKYDEPSLFDFITEKFSSLDSKLFSSQIPTGIKESVLQKILYIILRHRYWTHCPILLDAAEEHLIIEYNLPRETVHNLLIITLGFAKDFYRDYSKICCEEKDFLIYIFIECALHKSEEQLILSLGIGKSLIDKIHNAVDIASAIQLAEASAPLQFLPKLDALVAELLLDFESECMDSTKKLAFYRVKYSMIKKSSFLTFFSNINFIESLTDILLDLATRRSFSRQIFLDKANALTAIYKQTIHQDLIEDLINGGFFFSLTGSSRKGDRLEVTPFAKNLVASTVVGELIKTKSSDLSILTRIDEVFLCEYLYSRVMNVEGLEEMILRCRPLSPRILNQALTLLKNQTAADHFNSILESLQSTEKSFLLQKVVSSYLPKKATNSVLFDQSGLNMAKFSRLSHDPILLQPKNDIFTT
jgi:hypothetical protein